MPELTSVSAGPLSRTIEADQNQAAAMRFFKRVLATCPEAPYRIVTDQLRRYPAAKAEIPELANAKHVFVKASARVNNRPKLPSAHP